VAGLDEQLISTSSGKNSMVDRLPPFSLEAERGLLGSVFLDNNILHEVTQVLKPEDFYRESHQIIYSVMREMYLENRPVDFITLADELTQRQCFEKVGADEGLIDLTQAVPHPANAKFYSEIVKQKAVMRALIKASSEVLQLSYGNTLTAEELIEAAESRIFEISDAQAAGQTVELRDVVLSAMDRITERSENKTAVSGVGTGFQDLDDLTGGFQGSQLIILAARPSMGKTALALNVLDHVAVNLGRPALFFSLEMGQMELAERMLAARGRVEGHKLRTGHHLGTLEMSKIGEAFETLRGVPVFIDDTPSRTVLQITANARRLKMRNDIGLILIDYIQLIEQEDSRESRQEHIAKVSRRLKTLARELDVPVIALSQLNRGVETREDRRPRMADLRESGAIEQDADIVLLLHRPEYYDPNDSPGQAELIIAKNRSGATGSVKFTFLRDIMRFESLSQYDERFIPTTTEPRAGDNDPF
jgi:replicative DNA helicase